MFDIQILVQISIQVVLFADCSPHDRALDNIYQINKLERIPLLPRLVHKYSEFTCKVCIEVLVNPLPLGKHYNRSSHHLSCSSYISKFSLHDMFRMPKALGRDFV